jgi:hypothetical protein
MTKLSFKPVFAVVLLGVVSLSFMGCSGTLEQEAQTVRVSPVSDEYKLTERLQGKTYILLAETSTGQEQHRYAVSDSLARVLKETDKYANEHKAGPDRLVNLAFLGFNGIAEIGDIPNEGLDVRSFTDLTNKLNEKSLCQRYADMKKFYQENGMFRRSDLEFLSREIGADYLVLPCLLDIKRWSQGRLSVAGVKFLNTHIVSGMLGLEIWDTRTGRKVFSATSDVTLASEKIKEEPMSMEQAFQRAWYGIIQELPGLEAPSTTVIEAEGTESPGDKEPAVSKDLKNTGGTKAG